MHHSLQRGGGRPRGRMGAGEEGKAREPDLQEGVAAAELQVPGVPLLGWGMHHWGIP